MESLSSRKIIKKAIDFFQKYKIDFEPLKNICDSTKQFKDMLLSALVFYIIPIAFTPNYDNPESENEDDIIDPQFNVALLQIKDLMFRVRSRKMLMFTGLPTHWIKDSKYKENQFNFAIHLSHLGSEYDFYPPSFPAAYVTLPLRMYEQLLQRKQILKQKAEETDFEKMVKGFYKYPLEASPKPNLSWLDFRLAEENPSEIQFPIADVEIASRDELDISREPLIKSRLTAWHAICLHIFRHLARKLLAGRHPSGVVFIQSDEKSDRSSALDRKHPCAPDLISVSLAFII